MLASPIVVSAQALDYQALNKLIISGSAQAAYEQLLGLEDELSGDVQFDYALGLGRVGKRQSSGRLIRT